MTASPIELAVEYYDVLTVDEPYTGVIRLTLLRLNRAPAGGGWWLEMWADEALELAAALVRKAASAVRDDRERGPA